MLLLSDGIMIQAQISLTPKIFPLLHHVAAKGENHEDREMACSGSVDIFVSMVHPFSKYSYIEASQH